MINFNENLYTTQWLDLVFQNRNKSYGAYQLRKHNNETMVKAFLYACILFSSLIVIPWIYGQIATTIPAIIIPQPHDPLEVSLLKIPETKPITQPSQPPAKQEPVKRIQYTKMVVAPADPTNVEPPTQADIEKAVVSNITSKGTNPEGGSPIEVPSGIPGVAEVEPPSENTVFSLDAIEKYPEFPGGQEAFAKYLSRNLRYPAIAAENGIQGKVIVSFIIERNGDLSHIRINRSVGGGCDEEAIRVLAKSPQWKPGIQNNQKVRVAYTIPINFRLP